ncbi:unnamed protein product [Merluccius merluccius]
MEEEAKSDARLMDAEGGAAPRGALPEEHPGVEARGQWANKREFLLSMAGEIVGLGNVWRFPYLCYKNGGGVFFIPYFIFLFFCGIPVFFLETAMGQYTSEGGVTAWRKMCPMFEGIGYASQVIVVYMNIYYIVVLAWAIFYLYSSFLSPLPWTTCDNSWNTRNTHTHMHTHTHTHTFFSCEPANYTTSTSPEAEFWTNHVVRMSGDGGLGAMNWELALCLLIAWVVCYFCVFKGIRSTGKVVYFTATFPFLMLIILFIRGVTLPGAWEGIMFYLTPDISKLANPVVWRDAGTQVFFSYAVCEGILTVLGSYNKYNNNCYRDCIILCCLNSATSIFAGFTVFSVLGFMAHELGVSMLDVQSSGPGLAFIAYPRALSMLPGSAFWAVLFFLMILFLGLDSQFVCVESLATAITDMFPKQLRRRGRRELLVLFIAVVCFLLGLPLITEGGILLFQLVDTYGPSGIGLLFIACFETTVIGWVYGADRFLDNVEDMIGYRPFPVLKYCWLFFTPAICVATIFYELQTNILVLHEDYHMSTGMLVFASLLVVVPMMCVPVFLGVSLYRDQGKMTTPSSDLRQARPHKPVLTLCKRVIFKAQATPVAVGDAKLETEGITGV